MWYPLRDPPPPSLLLSAWLIMPNRQIPTFFTLIIGYNLHKHGLRFSDWWTDKSGDLSNTVQATSLKRKGRLEFPDNGFTRENVFAFVEWIWVWMK
jgi:yeast amino acid transporter